MTLGPLRGLSRRGLLTAAAGSALGLTGCSSAVAQRNASVDRAAYGPDPSQFGELYLPARIPLATVVVIHGGYWADGFVAEAMQPMCRALQADGYAVWNLEYRRVAEPGGGWHFDLKDGLWIDDKRGIELTAALEECLAAALGQPVKLALA